jgi:hypothetical protein
MVRGYGVFAHTEGGRNKLSPVGNWTKPRARQKRAEVMEWKMQTFFKFQGRHGHTENYQEWKCGDI